jgi:hypothetical protein
MRQQQRIKQIAIKLLLKKISMAGMNDKVWTVFTMNGITVNIFSYKRVIKTTPSVNNICTSGPNVPTAF